MTDFSPPSPSLPSFGTSVVGAEFTWQGVSEDGTTVETIQARAAASISFDETLRYSTGRHAQLVQTANSARQMREKLEAMSPTDDDYQERFETLVNERIQIEQASWRAAIDTMLLLVNESDRDKLRPFLLKGDPKQVTELRGWLEAQVLATAKADAAVATQVDPTLETSPENSSPSPASGDVSGSEESTSTG
jgi:hypothetical protein